MKCYKNGLNYYNRFLAKTLHIQLDDMKIYSKILSTDSINVMELHSYFVCDNKLNPIKYFAWITGDDALVTPVKNVQKTKEGIQFWLAVLSGLLVLWPIIIHPALKWVLDSIH